MACTLLLAPYDRKLGHHPTRPNSLAEARWTLKVIDLHAER
jgi:hypothetical protein